jgi:hypothetical protein
MKQLSILLPACLVLAACSGGSSSSSSGGTNTGTQGSLEEAFLSAAKLDATASTVGLWGTAGYLDSGLNPVTGLHRGGGHGALGDVLLDGMALDTDSQTVFSNLLGTTVSLSGDQGGIFFASTVSLSHGANAFASGSRPLRIFSRGTTRLTGTLDIGGDDAPKNFPMYRPVDERLDFPIWLFEEISAEMQSLLSDPAEAIGGSGGLGKCAAGDGGHGGTSWYSFAADYYDDSASGWYDWHHSSIPMEPRFTFGLADPSYRAVHGRNGGGVGGIAASGQPLPATDAALLVADRDAGSGMGSWAWPPKSNRIPLESELAAGTWTSTSSGYDILAHHWSDLQTDQFTRARARGGGGGGYWADGQRGDFHDEDPNAVDAFGNALWLPDLLQFDHLGVPAVNWDFNGQRNYVGDANDPSDREQWTSYLAWDQVAGGNLPDAAGGIFQPAAGVAETYFSLDPATGYLRGGSGGGGAGMSQHGSFSIEEFSGLPGNSIETYRTSDGGGGGGGGGALQIHAGNLLQVDGQVLATGGAGGDSAALVASTYQIDPRVWQRTLPGDAGGGGGSGGALLLQAGGGVQLADNALDLQGGRGGFGAVGNDGGAGGAGLLRIESPQPQSLADLANRVEPIEAFDLAVHSEFGLAGGNWSAFQASFPGNLGDLTVAKRIGVGSVFFNGNSSGVASSWYEVGSATDSAHLQGYQVTCLWSNGQGASGTLTYNTDQPTAPGITPIWIALQTDNSSSAGATPTAWVLPGYNTLAGGATELAAPIMARARFQLVFDHDLIAAQIGNQAGAFFRVTKVELLWKD